MGCRMPPPKKLSLPEGAVNYGNAKPTKEKYCIIGAGYVGLGVAAAFKRAQIPFDILENESDIGGNWHHGIYDTVHIISSKFTTQYLDFPMPDSYPDFPSAQQVFDYLKDYVKWFKLNDHLELNTQVIKCDSTNKGETWQITLKQNGETQQREYKGVIVAIGHHWNPRYPAFPGQDTFTGTIIHSKQYKNADILKGKRVVTVGGGNSACDIAVEAARCGLESHISQRRGYWVLPRTIMGIPTIELMPWYLPKFLVQCMIKVAAFFVVGRYTSYGLQHPDHQPMEHHPTINSDLLHFIKLGKIHPHTDIDHISKSTIHFKDGSKVNADMLVFATGFSMSVPMVDHLLTYKDGVPQLIGGAMLVDYKNIYVSIGGQVRYGAGPVITESCKNLVRIVQQQEHCKHSIGAILKSIGVQSWRKSKKASDVLIDPFHAMRLNALSKFVIPWLSTIEKYSLPPKHLQRFD